MTIGIDGTAFEFDGRGIAKVTNALYIAIHKKREDIELILLSKKKPITEFEAKHTTISSTPFVSWRGNYAKYFAKKIELGGVDFVHFPLNGFFSKVYGHIRPKTKIVGTIHDIIPAVIPEYYDMDENDVNGYLSKTQCCINMTDILITDSEHSKQDIIRKLKVKKEPIVIYCAPISSEKT